MKKHAKRIVGFAVAAVGFASAMVALWPYIFPPKPDHEIRLVGPAESAPVINGDQAILPNPLIGDVLRLDGELFSDQPLFIVANHLDMGESGKIRAREVTIFATRISGGLIDASGQAATESEPTHIDAGFIFVAAARIEQTRVNASGGGGLDGMGGTDGPDGQDGNCGGFGAWEAAQAGGIALDGGDGGSGGNGGEVILLLSALDGFPAPNVTGGDGGARGTGGKGGSGGAGCTGLGGSQASRSRGADGSDGTPGDDGANGEITYREIQFHIVEDELSGIDLHDPAELTRARQRFVRRND